MDLTPTRADAVPAAALHAAFVAAFADYLAGTPVLPPERWPWLLARQGIDLACSRVMRVDGQVVAFALVAPRHDVLRWRLATMGAVPAARGRGAAPALLDELIARAAAEGPGALELEAFAQNEAAQRLYRRRGFVAVHELHGYEALGSEVADGAADPGEPVALAVAFAWLDAVARARGDLPFQVTPASLAAVAGLFAWRLGSALLVANDPEPGLTVVHGLVDTDPAQRDAERLLRALAARRPASTLKVPPLQRPDLGGDALARAGWRRQPLHQLLMRRPGVPSGAT